MKDQLVPKIRFKEFEGEWDKQKLSNCASIKRGKFSPRPRNDPKFYGGDTPFIQTSDVVNSGGYIKNYSQTLNDDGVKVSKVFDKDTLMITIAANIGYVGVLQFAMASPDSLIGLKSFAHVESVFLMHVLTVHQKRMEYLAPEAAQKNINIDFLAIYSINLPTLPEQQKIASFLTLVDQRIAAARRRVKLLRDWKRGMMQRMIREKRAEWDFLFADKLFKSVSNKKHKGDHPVLAITQDEGAVFRDDLDRHIHSSQKSVASYKIVEPGDFIISLRSFQGGIEYSMIKGIASPAYTILKPKKPIVDGFYRSYMKYPDFISRLDEASIGIRDGRQISYTTFSELKLPYPPIEEQTQIARILTTTDTRITAAQQEVAGWEKWKQGLLQKMMV